MIWDYITECETAIEDHMYDNNWYHPNDHHAPLHENMPEQEIYDYVKSYMIDEVYDFANKHYDMITLDNVCKKQLSYVVDDVDDFIIHHSFKDICEKIKQLPYFRFDEQSLLSRITDKQPASFAISPFIVARTDEDNCGIHILAVHKVELTDEVIHILPFAGNNIDGKNDSYERFLDYCAKHHWYTSGISLMAQRSDAPPILIFGTNVSEVEAVEGKLKTTYGIKD